MGTTFLQRRLAVQSSLLDQQQLSSSLGWGEILMPVRDLVHQAGSIGTAGEAQVAALVQRHLSRQATVAAYQDCFILLTLLGVAITFLLLLLRKPKAS